MRRLFISFFVLSLFAITSKAEDFIPDSVLFNTTFYYPINSGDCISRSDYKKCGKLLKFIESNLGIPVLIVGCCDNSGNPLSNEKLAFRRAMTIYNYLVRKGVDKNILSIKSNVYTSNDIPASKLRKAEVYGYMLEVDSNINEKSGIETTKSERVEINPIKTKDEQAQQEPIISQNQSTCDELLFSTPLVNNKWYIGVEGGISFGRCTFASYAMDKTHIGKNASAFLGYKINPLLSAELSLDYTSMTLATYDCCQNLYLGSDGNRYFAPVAGMECFKYTDLMAETNLYGFGAHLNIDFLSLLHKNTRWSAFLSPALYGVVSSTKLLKRESSFHAGAGIDMGVGYRIGSHFGIRFLTGINYLMGKGIDSLPKGEHKTNYIWNSRLGFTYGF